MYYVTVSYPTLADGAEVELEGLGIFHNGETGEVSTEAANTFRLRSARTEPQYAQDEDGIRVLVGASLVVGPTVAAYFRDNPYVIVSTSPPKTEDEPAPSVKEEQTPPQPRVNTSKDGEK